MKKVNWEIFFGNSSTEEAVILFALGKYSFNQFSKECWPKECKVAIKFLKHKGYKKATRSAQEALRRHLGDSIGYLRKEYSFHYD